MFPVPKSQIMLLIFAETSTEDLLQGESSSSGPEEKKNIHQNCIQLDKPVQTTGSEKRTNNNNSVRLFKKLLKIYLFRVRLKTINRRIQSCRQNKQENNAG